MPTQTDIQTDQATFALNMESPGPSQGDAFEFMENQGLNPWNFSAIQLVSEVNNNGIGTGTFEVTCPSSLVENLKAAIAKLPAPQTWNG